MKTNKSGEKKRSSNLLTTLLIAVLFIVISYVAVYFLYTAFTSRQFFWNVGLLKNKTFHLVAIVLSFVLDFVTIYTLAKYHFFSFSKIVNKVERADSDAFGSSRWQTTGEIKQKYGDYAFSKLPEIEAEGFVLNSNIDKKGELRVSMIGEQHSLCVGAPGTGKSLFLLSPTIQANAHSKTKVSMVINDLKGELYALHSQMLKDEGYDVIKLDLRNPHSSDRYNPLSLIWDLYYSYLETKDGRLIDRVSVYINEIATCLCPEGTGDQKQWAQGAQSIIKSVIWAMLEDSTNPEYHFTRNMFTILQISNIVNRQKKHIEDFLTSRERTSPVFDYAGMILDNPSEKTVGSYFATVSTALEGFLEPGLQKVTSDTDIDITKLSSQPTAIFVIIPDELKSRNIVGTMIVSQIYNYLTFEASQLPNEQLPKNVYFLLDEFGNLPKISSFPSWVALGRSRGIFFNIILQADSQLAEIYGEHGAKSITQSCQLQILLGASEINTLKRFEELFGKYTIYSRSANIDQTNASTEYKGSTSLTSVDLITLDQLQRIKKGEVFFKLTGQFPCHTTVVPFFEPKAQKFFRRGSMTEKGSSGRAAEIDKEKLYYDLTVRQAIYMQRGIKRAGPQASGEVPQNSSAEKEEENTIPCIRLKNVRVELYEALLSPIGIRQEENSYDEISQTVTVLVPEDQEARVREMIISYFEKIDKNKQSTIDKNFNFLFDDGES